MEIGKNTMVSLAYVLRIDGQEGQVIEQVSAEKPLQFLFGAGMMLPAFEKQLAGLSGGQSFEINLDPEEAYGELSDEAIVDLPRHIFVVDGKFDEELVKTGNVVPMMSGNGQRLNGRVLEVTEREVRMDFNHPLAGEELFFKGEVLDVRDATDDELAHYLTGGCRGCSGGNCGAGQGDGGCGEGCGC